jgi:hypothetical protein
MSRGSTARPGMGQQILETPHPPVLNLPGTREKDSPPCA